MSNRTLQEGTALSRESLESSLIQEGVRRLVNTHPDVPMEVRHEILNSFAAKLINSGYKNEFCQMIMVHSTVCYVERLRRSRLPVDDKEFKPLYLSKEYNKETRMLNKLDGKTSWFRKKAKLKDQTRWKLNIPREWRQRKLRQRRIEGLEPSTVMIIPNTADNELLDRLIQKEAQLARVTGYTVKLIEGNGIPLARMFPPPVPHNMCLRDTCRVCVNSNKKSSKCSVRNIVYTAECLESDGNILSCTDKIYIGESSRSIAERSDEHCKGGHRLEEGNFITKHWLDVHPELMRPPSMKFTVVKLHKDPLGREVEEALMIEKANSRLTLMNSRGEWNSGTITRLSVEKSDRELKKLRKGNR